MIDKLLNLYGCVHLLFLFLCCCRFEEPSQFPSKQKSQTRVDCEATTMLITVCQMMLAKANTEHKTQIS